MFRILPHHQVHLTVSLEWFTELTPLQSIFGPIFSCKLISLSYQDNKKPGPSPLFIYVHISFPNVAICQTPLSYVGLSRLSELSGALVLRYVLCVADVGNSIGNTLEDSPVQGYCDSYHLFDALH